MDFSDQQLLMAQQRLIDAKKMLNDDMQPEEMLDNLRSEVNKNREMQDRINLEIQEKIRQL